MAEVIQQIEAIEESGRPRLPVTEDIAGSNPAGFAWSRGRVV